MSRSIVRSLRVVLGLDSARFSRGSSQATSHLQRMRATFTRVSAAASAVGAALAGVTVATVNAANETARFATVANTTPERLQAMAAATETVGVTQERLADILKDVNDRVGDFLSTGGGQMRDFFEQVAPLVGVTAEQFRNLSGPDALQLYVDTLERAGLNQQELTFYMEAMANDATLLLPLLRDNGAELARLAQDAEDFGAVLDNRTVAAMQRVRVQFMQVGQVMTGIRNQISTALLPLIETMANAFLESAREGGVLHAVIQSLGAILQRAIAYGGAVVAVFGVRLAAAFIRSGAAARALAAVLAIDLRAAIARTGIGLIIIALGEAIYQFSRLVRAAGGVGEALNMLGAVAREVFVERMPQMVSAGVDAMLGRFYALGAGFVGMIADMRRELADFVGSFADFASFAPNNAVRAAGVAMRGVEAALRNSGGLAETQERLSGIAAEYAGTAAALREAAMAPLSSIEALRAALAGQSEETDEAGDALRRLNESLEENGGGAAGRTRELANAMEQLKDRISAGAGVVADFFMSWLDGVDSARQALRQLATQFLRSGLMQFLSNRAAANPTGVLGTILQGLAAPGRAAGGNAVAGMLYEVNENTRRREFFAPAVTGTVVPLGRQGTGGGLQLSQEFHNYAGSDVDVRSNTVQQPDGSYKQAISVVKRGFSDGAFDGVMAARTGVSPRVKRR
jgi:hypothetical protein